MKHFYHGINLAFLLNNFKKDILMSTKFTWKINGLLVLDEPIPNTVTMSNFTITGEEDDLRGAVTYSVNLPVPEKVSTMTPYDAITEDDAIEWTKGALGVDRVAAMEEEVQIQIEAQKVVVPRTESLPWGSV